MPLSRQRPDLPEGMGCVDSELLEKLRDGSISKLPERALDCLPPDVRDRIPDDLIEFASANPIPTLLALVVGVAAVLGLLYKLAKRAFVAALLLGAVAAAAWWWWLARIQ
ncbi:hypothetical protein [Candidatus Poriferisocius sp.]|uniref:hypothetical protein n=1 Tax=Candidatus Poriferisocius sp. TaxID=3101276 RepID=UPI003B029569